MAYVSLFSFSLFASTLMVGIADPVPDLCPMQMSSRYFIAARYCTNEIKEKTEKAVPCNELYSLFQKICSFNSSVIDQAVPIDVTNDSCTRILGNIDLKYLPYLLHMTNGSGSIVTLCKTYPDASAVFLALYQLKNLIPGEKSPKQPAVTAKDTVTRPTTVSPETSSTKSTTVSSTTSGNIISPAASPTQKKTTAATRGSDPISTIANVTSTTSPSMPYTTAKEKKSQQAEKAAVTENDTVDERNSTEPAVLRANDTAAESPDPASNSSAVKSSSTTTTTTTTSTIAAATTIAGPKNKNIKTNITSDVPEGPKNKNIKTNITSDVPEEAGNDSTGKNDEDNEAGNDSAETNYEEYELTTNNPGNNNDEANHDDKDETGDLADQVGTKHLDEKDETDNSAEKVDTSKLEDNPSSYNFLIYFLAFIVLCVAVYIVLHNKHKIIAFIIEGKQGRRGGRPSTKQYAPLKSKVEDVMPFIEKSTTQSNYIY